MSEFTRELQKLESTALIELYELDLSRYGGPLQRFHAGTNGLEQDVIWQGNSYPKYAIEISGFEKSSGGALPRPTVRMSNIEGVMAAYSRQYSGFLGCELRRKRTFAKFLDAENFPDGNPNADPNQFVLDEVWIVDRKANENPTTLEFELCAAIDAAGVMLPRRQMIQNCCSWLYRSPNCGYSGGPVADGFGVPTSDPSKDKCGGRLSDCKLRFGAQSVLPYGGFPGCGLTRY